MSKDWESEKELSFDAQFGDITSYLALSLYKLLLEYECENDE